MRQRVKLLARFCCVSFKVERPLSSIQNFSLWLCLLVMNEISPLKSSISLIYFITRFCNIVTVRVRKICPRYIYFSRSPRNVLYSFPITLFNRQFL